MSEKKLQVWNPATNQYEDSSEDAVEQGTVSPNGVGTGTGVAPPTAAPAAPAAFDRNAFRDASMGRAQGQSPADFIAANPQIASGVTSYQGSKDKFVLPGTNEVIDLSINADANGVGTQNGWTGTGFNAFGVPDAPAAGSGGAASGASASGAGGSASDPYQAQLRALLLQKLQEFGQPVTGDDPAIKGVNDAYRVSRTRAAQQERAASAERSAFEGLNSGGQGSGSFDSEINGINETAGQDMASHDSGVVLQELQQRRALLQNFLNMALQSGDNESARALQLQIATMDETIKREQMAQSGSQFNAQLGQQQSQFNDQYGASRGDAETSYVQWLVEHGGMTLQQAQAYVAQGGA